MPSPFFFRIKEYIKYRLRAKDTHDLHSPFVYELYNKVLSMKDGPREKALLTWRKSLYQVKKLIIFIDPKTGNQHQKSLGQLARKTASSHRFACFLMNLVDHFSYDSVLETGTSIGITTTYLAHSNASKVATIEGSKEIATIANQVIEKKIIKNNVLLLNGNVFDVFPQALKAHKPELVFLDADHRSTSIQFYLDTLKNAPSVKCIVVHDIYWSPDMNGIWKEISNSLEYSLTIDIFQAGIIFPNYPMEKQHFTLKF